MRRPVAAAIGAALVLVLVAGADASDGTTRGRNGPIAFARYRMQDAPLWSEIYVMNIDGSGVRKVSHSATAVEDDGPQWSPGGDVIVFNRCRKALCSVWTVGRAGSGQRQVSPPCPATGECADYSHASFAPDGRHVLAMRTVPSTAATAIVSIDLATGGESSLVEEGRGNAFTEVSSPKVSPDGTRLLLKGVSQQDFQALFVTPMRGGSLRRLTPWRMQAATGDWSPDGTHVLFQSRTPTGEVMVPGTAMYEVRADGVGGPRKLSSVPVSSYVISGSYSPDGKWIVYGAGPTVWLRSGATVTRDLVKQRIGSPRVTVLTHTVNLEGWPTWGRAP
jgi:Tol biopolymer transport system component